MEDDNLKMLSPNSDTDIPKEQAKYYLTEKDIQPLFECLTAGLLYHKPEDPVLFVQDALAHSNSSKDFSLKWNSFIEWDPPARSRPSTAKDADGNEGAPPIGFMQKDNVL